MSSSRRFIGGLSTGILVVGTLSLGATGCAVRAPRSTGMGQDPSMVEASALRLSEVEGEVAEVDPQQGKIRIQEGERSVELRITDDTSLYTRGGVASLSDIEEGSEVRAAFSADGLDLVANWVEVPREEILEDEEGAQEPPPAAADVTDER